MNPGLRYFLFSLYLLSGSCLFSCATQKTSGIVPSQGGQQQVMSGPWKLKARLLPGFTVIDLAVNGRQTSNDSYNLIRPGSDAARIITYSFDTKEQCSWAAKQLKESGMVAMINITSNCD